MIGLSEQMISDRKGDLAEIIGHLTATGLAKPSASRPKAAPKSSGRRSAGSPQRRSKA
jgi:hypothetical protein